MRSAIRRSRPNACSNEIGLSLEYGGNKKFYENHVVGFWGDFMVYITTNSDVGTTALRRLRHHPPRPESRRQRSSMRSATG